MSRPFELSFSREEAELIVDLTDAEISKVLTVSEESTLWNLNAAFREEFGMCTYEEEYMPMPTDSCATATRYLKYIGRSDAVYSELSTDGYTLLALANSIWKRRSKC